MHIGLDLVRRAKEQSKIKAETVAADAWFFVIWFVTALLQIPGIKRVVSKLKVDQMVLCGEKLLRADELWDLPGLKFRHERKKHYKLAKLRVLIEGLGQKGRNLIVYVGPRFLELFGDLPPALPP